MIEIVDIKTLQDALKQHIQNDPALAYIEAVEIRKYRKNALPDFNVYGLVISPVFCQRELITNRQFQYTFKHEIVCIVRNFDEELSLRGTEAGEIGIQAMIEQVGESLFLFGEANLQYLDILYDEFEEEIPFDQHPFPDREAFFHEVKIPYQVRLKKTKTF
jgi:hypothetical protein